MSFIFLLKNQKTEGGTGPFSGWKGIETTGRWWGGEVGKGGRGEYGANTLDT
jgi:hypothetical protein